VSQHDFIIANDSGVNVRADINNGLQALASTSKGTARPSTAYAGQLWVKDDVTPWLLYCFDGAADILLGQINATTHKFIPCHNSLSLASLIGDGSAGAQHRNRIINGGFDISQLHADFPTPMTDTMRSVDCWYSLGQGAGTVYRISDLDDGQPHCLRMYQNSATAYRLASVQIIEAAVSQGDRGKAMVLSARVRCSISQAVRYAVLAWTGTADDVTRDVVDTWTSLNYTPGSGNFFVATNISVVAVGAIIPAANTWTDVTPITGTGPSGLNNWIILFWSQDTLAQGASLDLGRVQFEPGAVATPFVRRPVAYELALCQRFICKTWEDQYHNMENMGLDGALTCGTTDASGFYGCNWRFPVPMRGVPSISLYDPLNYTQAKWTISGGSVTSDAVSIDIANTGCNIQTNGGTLWTPGAYRFRVHASAIADL
jgi:hypothetical protein